MSAQAEPLDQREPTGRAFLGALTLHVAVVAGMLAYSYFDSNRPKFGKEDAGGGAVGVEAVKSIPLAHRGIRNPVANDSTSEAPTAPAKKEAVKELDEPDAIRIKGRTPKKSKATAARPRLKQYQELASNQLTSTVPQAVSNPLYTAQPGSGRIGVGDNNLLGNRFPAYAAQIRTIIAQKWRTGDVDASVKTAPIVVSTFEILQDGSVRGLSLLERSGISSLDYSVQRAIQDASPFPPLPQGFDRSSAKVEMWFELKR
jgi:TonB family protein